jgi:nuclear protein localization family protein 4
LYYGPDRKTAKEITSSRSKTIATLGLGHGDILYLQLLSNKLATDNAEPGPSSRRERQNSVSSVNNVTTTKSNIEEDPIDVQLWGEDGKIERGRDPKL